MRRRRNSRRQASGSLLLLLIIAAALLAVVPVRVTLAAGSTSTTVLDSPLGFLHGVLTFVGIPEGYASLIFPKNTQDMLAHSGSHYDVDSLSIFLNSSILTVIIRLLAGSTPPWARIATAFSTMDYLGVKIFKATIDFSDANQSPSGLLQPLGPGPTFTANASAITAEMRIVLLSVTITGYKLASNLPDPYNENTPSGLNEMFSVTLDRMFLDLFVDPQAGMAIYTVSADMTVYQALAVTLMSASL